MALPMGIEPISPGHKSGCSLAVELRGDQMDKWRDRTEALHAGNRTRTAKASPRTVRPPYWWRINDQLRPIRNWGGQTDLHRYQRRHGAQCCCYTMTTIFKRGVGSSECRMPERYTNRFPAQPIPQSSFRTLHLNGAPGRTRTDEYGFTKPAL